MSGCGRWRGAISVSNLKCGSEARREGKTRKRGVAMVHTRMNRGRSLMCLLILLPLFGAVSCNSAHGQVPEFAGKAQPPAAPVEQTAVLAGGCFWGVDAVFKHVRGVSNVFSGYAGGSAETAQYEVVSTGTTGHAESVKVTYDPFQVSYAQLLRIFFSVAHDPTELNRQGPDTGKNPTRRVMKNRSSLTWA